MQVQVNDVRPPRWVCAVAVLAIVALPGCGSASQTSSQSTGAHTTERKSAGKLTRAQYKTEAEAVCTALERTSVRLSTNKKSFRQKVQEAIRARRATNELLRRIPASSAVKFVPEWLRFREASVQATEIALETTPGSDSNKLAGEREYEATEKARAIAKAAGLSSCVSAP
ncbi:MAG TPA: hypothetical protein VN672_08470 [Solirubrobacteraceae bacterium]|nr:hypothetical protein [Solirubrobacteraceae bacterium]